jgi:drug/metabolite transporter, DME family
MNRNRWLGPLLIVGAAVLWSSGGLGIKSVTAHPLVTAGWRSFFAIPVLIALGGLRNTRRSDLRKPAFLATSLAYATTLVLFVSATRLTTAANAILLQYTAPVWVIALSIPLLRERPVRRDFIVAAGCIAGLVFFFLDRLTFSGLLGNILAIMTGFTLACLIIGLRHHGTHGEQSRAVSAVVVGNVICIAVCSPWMIRGAAALAPREWLILAALGALQIAVPYMMFSAGLQHVAALRATLLAFTEPILNPVWVMLGTGEAPGIGALVGGSVILSCLVADAVVRQNRLRRLARTGKMDDVD